MKALNIYVLLILNQRRIQDLKLRVLTISPVFLIDHFLCTGTVSAPLIRRVSQVLRDTISQVYIFFSKFYLFSFFFTILCLGKGGLIPTVFLSSKKYAKKLSRYFPPKEKKFRTSHRVTLAYMLTYFGKLIKPKSFHQKTPFHLSLLFTMQKVSICENV